MRPSPTSAPASRSRRPTVRSPWVGRSWIAFFGIWLVAVSGLPAQLGAIPGLAAGLERAPPPGVWQAYKLRALLEDRRSRGAALEDAVANLQTEANRLETDGLAIEREIRRTLGYLRQDEILIETPDARPLEPAAGSLTAL